MSALNYVNPRNAFNRAVMLVGAGATLTAVAAGMGLVCGVFAIHAATTGSLLVAGICGWFAVEAAIVAHGAYKTTADFYPEVQQRYALLERGSHVQSRKDGLTP